MVELINPKNNKVLKYDNKNNYYFDSFSNKIPIINDIPRFVENDNYANNFGFQWNNFTSTQIDRKNFNLSYKRFKAQTGKKYREFNNKLVLEVGSGAGRFSNILLSNSKVELHSVDLSNAVEANKNNNDKYYKKNFYLYQADVYNLPFKNNSFDFVFCFGVLQHTPDVDKTIYHLITKAKKNAEIVVDFYPIKGWYTKIHAKYFFRNITNKLSNETLLKIIKINVGWLSSLYIFLKKIRLGFLTRFLPICDFDTHIISNLNKKDLKEWIILDTFDQYSTKYDSPQKIKNVKKIFEKYNTKVVFADFVKFYDHESAVVRAVKK